MQSDDKYDAARQLHQVLLRLDRLVQEVDREIGATAAQLSALAGILVFERTNLKDLAAHEAVAPPTMARIVDSLVSKGWVARVKDTDDRRSMRLSVTPKGQQALTVACDQRTARLVEEFADLSLNQWAAIKKMSSSLAILFGYAKAPDPQTPMDASD